MIRGDDAVRVMAARVAETLGLVLLDARWTGGGASRTLQLVVDRPGGISADECRRTSEQFDLLWEVDHPDRRDFGLEVTSPGPDRPLASERDFGLVVGRWVEVTYARPSEAGEPAVATVTAEVAGAADGVLALTADDETYRIPLGHIRRAKVIFAVGQPTAGRKSARRNKRT